MSIEPEGWYMDAGPPSWDAEAKTLSFFLCKRGHERVLCVLTIDALEEAYAVVPGRPICGIGGRAPAAAIRAHEALRGRCLNRNAAQRASSGKLA